MDDIFFTVIDTSETEETGEAVIGFFPDDSGAVVELPQRESNAFHIDNQQLGELGHLLIALSRGEYDNSSVDELLDGYGIKRQS